MSYVICEQQRRRSACASAQSEQRLYCSLLRYYNISRFYSRNFKTLASFCGCAGRPVCVWPGRKLPKIRFVVSWLNYILISCVNAHACVYKDTLPIYFWSLIFCVSAHGYGKYQNPEIDREGILIYGCVCVYA